MANHESLERRSSADTEGEVSRVLGRLETSGQDLTILRVLANAPGVFRPFVMMANALVYRAALPADVRESLVLWLAARRNNSYERAEHVPMAARAGLSDEQIGSLTNGDLSLCTANQRYGIEAVDELLTDGALSAERWSGLIERWGVEGTIELVLSAGWWGGLVPLFLDAIELEVPDSNRTAEGRVPR